MYLVCNLQVWEQSNPKKYAQNVELKKYNGNRGSKHFIYINRTLFGLYNLMHSLKADEIKINNFKSLLN